MTSPPLPFHHELGTSRRRKVKHLVLSGLQQQHGIGFHVYESSPKVARDCLHTGVSVAITQCSPCPFSWSPGEKPRGGFSWKEGILLFLLLITGVKSWDAVWRRACGHPAWRFCSISPNVVVVVVGLFWELFCPRLSLCVFLVWAWTRPFRSREEGRAEQPNVVTAVASRGREGPIHLGLAQLGSARGCSWGSMCPLKLMAAVFRGTQGRRNPLGIPPRNSLGLSSSFCCR